MPSFIIPLLPLALNSTLCFLGNGRLRQRRLCFQRTRWTHFCPNPYIMVLGWMNREMLTCAELWWKGRRSLRFRTTGALFLAQITQPCSIFSHRNSILPGSGWMLLAAKSVNVINCVIGLKGRRKRPFSPSRGENMEHWGEHNYWILRCLIMQRSRFSLSNLYYWSLADILGQQHHDALL